MVLNRALVPISIINYPKNDLLLDILSRVCGSLGMRLVKTSDVSFKAIKKREFEQTKTLELSLQWKHWRE